MEYPWYTYKDLRDQAEVFIRKYNPKRVIPVPIERIVDNLWKIDIVDREGLHAQIGKDGFTTSDLKWIFSEGNLLEDTGCGIPESRIPHLFDPFFTTKTDGRGTGLGLWLCRRVIQEHGGRISVETKVDEGTTIRLGLRVRSRQA